MRKWILSLVLLGTLTTLNADCEPCFEVGAQALYWKASDGGYRWAQLVPDPTPSGTANQRILVIEPPCEWGFRVFGRYNNYCCNFYVAGDYVRLRTSSSDSVVPDSSQRLVVAFTSNGTSGAGQYKIDYDRANLRFGYLCEPCCRTRLSGFLGGRYVDLRREVNIDFTEIVTPGFGFENFVQRFEGGGLEFGFTTQYALGCGFSVSGVLGGVVVMGDAKTQLRFSNPTSASDLVIDTVDPVSICRPGSEFNVMLNYDGSCSCMSVHGGIGYELDYYYRILGPLGRALDDRSSGLGFGGLVLSLAVGF